MIWTGPAPRESQILTSERIEAEAAPEPRRSRQALARENYDPEYDGDREWRA